MLRAKGGWGHAPRLAARAMQMQTESRASDGSRQAHQAKRSNVRSLYSASAGCQSGPACGVPQAPTCAPGPHPMRAYGRAWMALRSNGAMPLLLRAARYRAHYRTPAPARRSARLAGCRGLQGPCGAADGPRAGCCALMLPQAPAGPWWPVARPAAPCKAKPRIARCFAALHVSQLRARLVCPRWCSARGRGPCRVVARATASARRPAALQRQAAA